MKNGRFNFFSIGKRKLKQGSFLAFSFVFLLLLKLISVESDKPLSVNSEIRLIISKSNTRLLSHNYKGDMPYKIIINGNEENFRYDFYDLNEDINYITLKFNFRIKTCEFMFEAFDDILEIDLSDFDMSQVTSMKSMFTNCNNLKYINLTNINLSSVKDVNSLFYDCISLTSIDLSNHDLSNVTDISYMFDNCNNLKYINLSNIKLTSVEDMSYLFYYLNNLMSIDLSNSDFSNVVEMRFMFNDQISFINLNNIKASILEDMSFLFVYFNNLISIDLSNSDFSNVMDISYMFAFCTNLTFINLTNIKLSSVENMEGAFGCCYHLTSIDLSNLDFSNLYYASFLFYNCSNLQYINLTSIKLSSIEYMNNLFEGCINLTSIDLSNLDLPRIYDMSSMFSECTKIQYINLTNINLYSVYLINNLFFNCISLTSIDLSNLDLSNVRYAYSTFGNCNNLEYVNLTNTKLSSIWDMRNFFSNCQNLTSLDLSNHDLSDVGGLDSIFKNCYHLKSINLSNIKLTSIKNISYLFSNLNNLITVDLSNSDLSNVVNISNMIYNCSNLEYINLSNIILTSIEDMSYLFSNLNKLISIDLSNSDLSRVKYISYMFYNCSNLKYINLTNIKLLSVKKMNHLFWYCTSLTSIDLSNLDVGNVNDISHLFHSCINLEYINFKNIKLFSVEDMSYLFSECSYLISVDLSNLYLSKVKDISYMFYKCNNLEYVNLTNIKLSSVEDMSYLFRNCYNFISIDLSNLDLSYIRNIQSMFENCYDLEYINLTNIKLNAVEDMSYTFSNCYSLTSIDLRYINSSNIKKTSRMFMNCNSLISLNLSNFNTYKVSSADYMFSGCNNLLYLELSNFNSLKIESIRYMFYGCKSLIYLKLSNLKLNDTVSVEFSFKDVPSYTIYCIKDTSTQNLLGIKNNDCSHPCFKNNRKLDLYNKACTELCINNKILYEYNNICYTKCPKGTLVNGSLCEDININNIPEEYYYDLKDELYKKCYDSCKSCNNKGNYKNHNCIECKSNYIFFNDSIYKTNCYKKCEYYYYFDDLNNYYHCTENDECPEKYNKLILDKKKCINDCKNDNIYQYEFENQCLKYCPQDTYYNENDKICIYMNSNNKNNDNKDNIININTNYISLSNIIEITNEISIKICHPNCKECIKYSSDNKDMKCISCKDNLYMMYGTQNCVNVNKYSGYFIYLKYLYPCSSLSSSCYECDPYLSDYFYDQCISCMPGYIYNEKIKICETCKEDEYPITIEKFDSCKDIYTLNCELYITKCIPLKNIELENICNKYNFNNETCIISNKKKIIFINWLKEDSNIINYPSYNNDKTNYLLIELTLDLFKRKLYFYNEDGRGLFNEINDKYEKIIENRRAYNREISSSIVIKSNNYEEYLLNFENYNNNLELIDIKTGEIFIDNLFNFLWIFNYTFLDSTEKPTTYLLELNENNQFLLATFAKYRINNKIVIIYFIFSLENSKNEKINIDSLNKIEDNYIYINNINFNIYARFYFIQTKKGYLYLSFVSDNNELYYYNIKENKEYYIYTLSNKMSFQKLLLIKNEIKFLSYYSNDKHIVFIIFEQINNLKDNIILKFQFKKYLPYLDNNDYADVIFISEVKAIFILEQINSITIFIINFFNNYKNFVKNEYLINIYGKGINNLNIYSLIFKYRNMIGIQFKNKEENGFILFGYYNSTDPKQILDIKKDGLFYNINLKNYLNLQSNIFDYEIKCIKINEIPNPNISGLYLFSNITKNFIQKNDCIDINTKISLYFSYNGTLKKNNYFFKFVGVLQEPKYEIVEKNSEEIYWNLHDNILKNKYIKEYNERRNMNITGRVALIQINILNDIKVFCDKKYDKFGIKSKEGKLIACGEGKFYNVENVNEITQLNLGKNYYFDKNKNCYIKCHEKCQTCSREFNNTHMNCDLCIENFFIRNDNCLSIPKCEYNYYYDKDLNLKCINKDEHCPDFKPYENITTKECIENCSIYEFNKECIPTNNIIAIKDTYKKIFNNIKYLNLEEKLFINKTKYIIFGNNITFIFSTSEIEKNDLYNNYNTSSIIITKSEKYIKQYYSINEKTPIPVLKIEILNNHSNDSELYYDFFNPNNLSLKLNLNLLPENYIEIRKPKYLKSYKMDIILKTRDLGYNIFDLNDSFYNDICSIFSYNNTDFSLSERKNIIDLSDEHLCINIYNYSCNYSNYDIYTLNSICLCKIGTNENYTKEINNENNKDEYKNIVNLVKQNIDISKSSNIKVVKCFSIIFRKNLFTENYGFYIMFVLLLMNFITLIYSPISKIEKLFNEYCKEVLDKMKIIYNKNNNNNLKNKIINENNDKNSDLIIENNNTFPENINQNKKKNLNKKISIINPHKMINKTPNKNKARNIKINLITSSDYSKEKSDNSFKNIKMNNSDVILYKDKTEEELIKKLKEKINSDFYIYKIIKTIEHKKRKEYLSEYEIENLSYNNALDIEDRNNSEYYFSLLKEKNKIISTFLNNDDYNIQSIKISTFILEFVLSLTVNALFYNDEAIYQINQEKEDTSLIAEYSRIIYSAIISGFLNYIIEILAFSHKKIIELRYNKEIKKIEEKIPKLIKLLKIKSIIYYAMSLFLNIIFLYYITSFCAIYTIIQTHMISDASISFLLAMSYTIILSLISSIIRVFSLKEKNKFRHFLYIISWIISLI